MNKELREFFKRYQQGYSAAARLEYYFEAAQSRKETATESEAAVILMLERNIQTAEQAIAKSDIDRFAQAFERTIRRTVELNLPQYDETQRRVRANYANKAKNENYAKLESFAIKQYENGQWHSTRQASIRLIDSVVKYAKDEKLPTLKNPQDRIYRWLLKHKNKT